MTDIKFRGGRLSPDPTKPRLSYAAFRKVAAVSPPASVDFLSQVSDWPMYLNDRVGDCTIAGAVHANEIWSTYGDGNAITTTDLDVLHAYHDVSGYNPNTGANDNGARMQDVLAYWRTKGIGGRKILAFAAVDPRDTNECKAAVAEFGCLYLGITLPQEGMDQFNKGEEWDVLPNEQILGGHCIISGWYDSPSSTWKVVTWGKVQTMSQAFFDTYVEEAWVIISPAWFNAQGKDPLGVDLVLLKQQFTQLTGEPLHLTVQKKSSCGQKKDAVLNWLGLAKAYFSRFL